MNRDLKKIREIQRELLVTLNLQEREQLKKQWVQAVQLFENEIKNCMSLEITKDFQQIKLWMTNYEKYYEDEPVSKNTKKIKEELEEELIA